jgi:primase-polymerase (primpol)-like protein
MTIAFDQIADAARWVAWREEGRNGKPTKVPYCPVGEGRAKANDPATWGTHSQAKAKAEQLRNGHGNSGIGIVLGDLGNNGSWCHEDNG